MADSDDWRVTISVSPAPAGQSSSLRQAEEDIRRQVGRGIGVGAGEARELAGQIRQDAQPDAAVMVEQAGVGWPFPPS